MLWLISINVYLVYARNLIIMEQDYTNHKQLSYIYTNILIARSTWVFTTFEMISLYTWTTERLSQEP